MADNTTPLVNKVYYFYKYLHEVIVEFPKTKRYSLGETLDITTIRLLELIMLAYHESGRDKQVTLRRASVKADLLKIFLRMSWELKCIDAKKYLILSSEIVEIGRMIGGWIKKQQ